MDIYKSLRVSKEPGPDVIYDNGDKFYRYMDRLYVPKPPAQLSKEEVSALSEIRIQLSSEIIDREYSLQVIKFLYDQFDIAPNGLIDFGCGGGLVADIFSEYNISPPETMLGLDLSESVLKYALKSYLQHACEGMESRVEHFDGAQMISAENEAYDAIIASFVMHFEIYPGQIEELYRVLKRGGLFVYNDYIFNRNPSHTKKVIDKLCMAGFSVRQEKKEFKHPEDGDIRRHLIVIAKKD